MPAKSPTRPPTPPSRGLQHYCGEAIHTVSAGGVASPRPAAAVSITQSIAPRPAASGRGVSPSRGLPTTVPLSIPAAVPLPDETHARGASRSKCNDFASLGSAIKNWTWSWCSCLLTWIACTLHITLPDSLTNTSGSSCWRPRRDERLWLPLPDQQEARSPRSLHAPHPTSAYAPRWPRRETPSLNPPPRAGERPLHMVPVSRTSRSSSRAQLSLTTPWIRPSLPWKVKALWAMGRAMGWMPLPM